MADAYLLSPECQHAKNNGCCNKCIINQAFGITKPEERQHHRNLSNGSIKSNGSFANLNVLIPHSVSNPNLQSHGQLQATLSPTAEVNYTSFPSLPIPVSTVLPQNADTDALTNEDNYTSFAELSRFSSVKIQEENNKNSEFIVPAHPMVEPSSGLMRLFESEHFCAVLAVEYIFSSEERGIRRYLGSRLSSLDDSEVDFYLPQLISMYINDNKVASAIHSYLEDRCRKSVHFALLCVWLLESYGVEKLRIKDGSLAHGEILRQMILNDFQPPESITNLTRARGINEAIKPLGVGSLMSTDISSNVHLKRSESAASSLRFLSPATLPAGRSLDSGCRCFEDVEKKDCVCGTKKLSTEKEFVNWLTRIGDRLKEEPSKREKTRRLGTELMMLNMQLPARVWIPLCPADHIVLRIPDVNSCVLNSKDKAPYCMYVEVLRCDDVRRVVLPKSLPEADLELHSRLRSSSVASLQDVPTMSSSVDPTEDLALSVDIPIVDVTDDVGGNCLRTLPDTSMAPEPAWDCMSLESSASEPVLRGGIHGPADITRKLKQWVNVRRPGRRRQMRPHPDDPSASTMSEPWEDKRERIRQASPYGRLSGWDLIPVIVKSGDDLLQELIAYQLLVTLQKIWQEEDAGLFVRPYKIVVTSADSGMIEPIVDACSLHQIKRNQWAVYQEEGKIETPSLEAHFIEAYGPKGTAGYLKAQQNFVESCAAYSLVCYFLQVKDRHNGNILIDGEGHLIHIDFGFILSITPKNLGFETSPFKLTTELIDVMGGLESDMFWYFKTLILKGLIAARKHQQRILTIMQISSKGSRLACFKGGATMLQAVRDRFHTVFTDRQLEALVDSMVEQSRDSLTTRLYDNFQYYTNGIL